ncbi:MAG: MmcQ/YjbR family DNA-binding protein [Pseudomonadota bacterium]
MEWSDIVALGGEFPEMVASTSYGTPALKVGKALVIRLREDGDGLVLFDVPHEERELLMAAEPEIFHLTPHYEDYAIVLARMSVITPDRLRLFIERRWRARAPKRAIKALTADR